MPALPKLRVVSALRAAKLPGMPGPYPGSVISVASDRAVDVQTNTANAEVTREMMARGMCALTGTRTPAEAWRRFFEPKDVVGIKVNCGGFPHCISDYDIVAETIRQLMQVGIPPSQIYVYERFQNQLTECDYASADARGHSDRRRRAREPLHRQQRLRSGDVPRGRSLRRRGHALEHDAARVAAADEDHQHSEHEGSRRHGRDRLPEEHRLRQLLQRRAHASARQVAHAIRLSARWRRSSRCARGRCCRSWTGCARVWHGGPFARTTRYVFYPQRILFGTDPVAIDRLLLDIIDDKRKAEGAISIWDRNPASLDRHARARRRSERQHPHPRAGAHRVRVDTWPWRLRQGQDSRPGDPRVTRRALLAVPAFAALAAAAPVVVSITAQDTCQPAGAVRASASRSRPNSSRASCCWCRERWRGREWHRPRGRPGSTPTAARFLRKPDARYRYELPEGKGALGAAEARRLRHGRGAAGRAGRSARGLPPVRIHQGRATVAAPAGRRHRRGR